MPRIDRIVSRSINSGPRAVTKIDGKGNTVSLGYVKVGTGGHWYRARLADLVERRRAKAKAAESARKEA